MSELHSFYKDLEILSKQSIQHIYKKKCKASCNPKVCLGCSNLVQNPSFETGLSGWISNNASVQDTDVFEGTQEVLLGPDIASLHQDISLVGLYNHPLFLSFNIAPGGASQENGNMVAQILWLDSSHNTISAGLYLYVPSERSGVSRITYFGISDLPPIGAVYARIQFSKDLGPSAPNDSINIDQVILTPVSSINLIQNSSFELGLTGWTSTFFAPVFNTVGEGIAAVRTTNDDTIFQDVPLTENLAGSSFLLSFACFAT